MKVEKEEEEEVEEGRVNREEEAMGSLVKTRHEGWPTGVRAAWVENGGL